MYGKGLKAGIYRLSYHLKGDLIGYEYPVNSKVFAMQTISSNSKPLTIIEGVVDGKIKQDILKDPVVLLMSGMTLIPCDIDFSDEKSRHRILQEE